VIDRLAVRFVGRSNDNDSQDLLVSCLPRLVGHFFLNALEGKLGGGHISNSIFSLCLWEGCDNSRGVLEDRILLRGY
jgi:hypothetical protein